MRLDLLLSLWLDYEVARVVLKLAVEERDHGVCQVGVPQRLSRVRYGNVAELLALNCTKGCLKSRPLIRGAAALPDCVYGFLTLASLLTECCGRRQIEEVRQPGAVDFVIGNPP